MSNLPRTTQNSSSTAEEVKSNDVAQKAESSNRGEKRSISEIVDDAIKKIKIETPTNSNHSESKFVAASTMIGSVPEFSDEELLKYALEFERQNGIQ